MIAEWVLDLVFPKQCAVCNSEGHYFCAPELRSRPIVELYPRRKRGWYLDGLIAASSYDNEAIRETIHRLKYGRVPAIADSLGVWMVERVGSCIDQKGVIVPVPLHRKRQIRRGFNQAVLLSAPFAQAGWRVNEALVRRQDTRPQVSLKRSARASNIAQAFGGTPAIAQLRGKTVFLLDDVATTGSTLNAAARVLKHAGVGKVFGVVAARD